MKKKQWVVDTWVLATCNDTDCGDCVDCADFLTYLLRKGKLCLDPEGEIYSEYSVHIEPRSFVFQWWQKMIGEDGHLCSWSSKLQEKHKDRLVKKLNFDKDDIKFVGVASRSTDKLLVSGDSGYNPNVCQYLTDNLEITVLHPNTALSI